MVVNLGLLLISDKMEKYEAIPIDEYDLGFRKRSLGRLRSLWERQSITVITSFVLNVVLVAAFIWNMFGSAHQTLQYLNTDVLLGRESKHVDVLIYLPS